MLVVAGTTGKIRGKVTDKQSGEPLVGASVVVQGTSMGASVNVEGEYVILNVPAGTHSIEAKYLGYQPYTIGSVLVNADLTTEVDFPLTALSEGLQLTEVVVQRERELINKNATNAVRIQTGDDIVNLPVRGVNQVVALTPGVVNQSGNIYIRGGRSAEVGYYLEGANTRNVLVGGSLTTVIPEALEEFQVQAGGYNAQYGGANSGIIRASLRSGSQQFKATFQAETDRFTSQNQEALGTYSYGYSDYVLTLSGPLLTDRVKFFIAGQNTYLADRFQRYWTGFRFENLPNLDAPASAPETLAVLEVKEGNIPNASQNRWTTNGSITVDFSPLFVRLGGSYTYQRNQGTTNLQNILAFNRLTVNDQSDLLLNAKVTYIFNPQFLVEASISYGDNRNKNFDRDYEDNIIVYYDSLYNARQGWPNTFKNYTDQYEGYNLYGFPFTREGTQLAGYRKDQQERLGGVLDFTYQIGTVHEIKFGGTYDSYTLRQWAVGARGLLNALRNNPDEARTPGEDRDLLVRKNGGTGSAIGYDLYGNKVDDESSNYAPKQPLYWGAYVQDKIEYSDLTVNAGLRFDYMDNDDFYFIDDPTTPDIIEGEDNPSIDGDTKEWKATGIAKKDPITSVSPRLGFAFPVTDQTVFHVQWGKFVQAPRLRDIFNTRAYWAEVFDGKNAYLNPFGFDLDPERTTMYELGFTQQLSEAAAFDITAYYKDIKGQIQVSRVTTTPESIASGYNKLVNGDFATTKGIEISFRLRRTNRITAQVNYTLSDAKGTGSATNAAVASVENGTLYPTVISPLDFEQTHRGSVNFDYRFGENDGGPILERLGLNILFTFNSGHPYTLSEGSAGQQGVETGALIESDARNGIPLEAVNASMTPWVFNVDLRLDKTVSLGPLSANFYIYTQNLLNTRNVLNVYRRSGNAWDDGYLSNPELSGSAVSKYGQGYVDLYRALNLEMGQHYQNVVGQPLWGTPRQIRFGVRLEY